MAIPILAVLLATRTTLSTVRKQWSLAASVRTAKDFIVSWRKSQETLTSNREEQFLLARAVALPSAQAYLKTGALEYQKREGYCSSATQRCILRSIQNFPRERIPPAKFGPSNPSAVAESLNAILGNALCRVEAHVVAGSEGYAAFREAISKANNHEEYRIAVNFLRSALFGMPEPTWLPSSYLMSLVGGHFSPVIGFLEAEDLVVVFDVNHQYGFYLCPSRKLFDAVNTKDISSRNGGTRGLVVARVSQAPPAI
jgi:hypothetical protein